MEEREPTAWFTIQCWGCNKAVSRPYSSYEDSQQKTEALKTEGWRRRTFGGNPNASPWFCSEDCAMNSYNAKQAEQWWADKEFQEYSQKSAHNAGIALFVLMLAVIILFGVCSYAGVQ